MKNQSLDHPDEPLPPHGTRAVPGFHHPVLDVDFWHSKFPPTRDDHEVYFINGPRDIVAAERARRIAAQSAPMGPSVGADLFVWSNDRDRGKPWLTKIGGLPWRERDRPWPSAEDGRPLHFLGQICFIDSHDVLAVPPAELPDQVLLFFGEYNSGYASGGESPYIEWSPLNLKQPLEWISDVPKRAVLRFQFQGVRHRSVQYQWDPRTEAAFDRAGYKDGGWMISALQATMIGGYANLPQGWPFGDTREGTLVAVLSSFYFRDKWPLCDAPTGNLFVSATGESTYSTGVSGLSLGIGDVGCIYVYREANGEFRAVDACA